MQVELSERDGMHISATGTPPRKRLGALEMTLAHGPLLQGAATWARVPDRAFFALAASVVGKILGAFADYRQKLVARPDPEGGQGARLGVSVALHDRGRRPCFVDGADPTRRLLAGFDAATPCR